MLYVKWIILLSLVLSVSVTASDTRAVTLAGFEIQDAGVYALGAVKKFDGLDQQGAFVTFRLPWTHASDRLRFNTGLTAVTGALKRDAVSTAFVSAGPTARMTMRSRLSHWFVELGTAPTYIDSPRYGDEDLGGSTHFTTHFSAGGEFGRKKQFSLSTRFQHISNAGLNSHNPGVDLWGAQWTYRFGA